MFKGIASTSTNKQPCLIDRPFLRGARINSGTTTVNPTNPAFADLVQLVRVGDLPTEDAALVEDVFVVSNEGYPNRGGIRSCALAFYIYAPNQAAPSTSTALMLQKVEVGLSGATEGTIQRIELPAINAPVPSVGDTNLLRPIEVGKGEGLYLEKGYILCVGLLGNGPAAISGGLSPSGITVFAQGGFY